ncbi:MULTISPECIES: hypothetical protein [unclassified Sphingobacterium]|uniref:hypothetical protein n=1 Tax=unclassified Sphingobacterium TaxID=2609468 RepID=UPI0025F4378F|nr:MULTISPECIES: hypothetical protein [unclassified Sphingobacterium]
MEKNKASSFIFGIIAIIVGSALYKQIDFENFKVLHKGLAVVYGLTFAFSAFILIKNFRNRSRS